PRTSAQIPIPMFDSGLGSNGRRLETFDEALQRLARAALENLGGVGVVGPEAQSRATKGGERAASLAPERDGRDGRAPRSSTAAPLVSAAFSDGHQRTPAMRTTDPDDDDEPTTVVPDDAVAVKKPRGRRVASLEPELPF